MGSVPAGSGVRGTRRSQTAPIEITPTYSGLVAHCDSIRYTHTVTHTGRYTDVFDFSASSTQGVNVTVLPPEITLGPEMTTTVFAEIAVPCSLVGPISDRPVGGIAGGALGAYLDNITNKASGGGL